MGVPPPMSAVPPNCLSMVDRVFLDSICSIEGVSVRTVVVHISTSRSSSAVSERFAFSARRRIASALSRACARCAFNSKRLAI